MRFFKTCTWFFFLSATGLIPSTTQSQIFNAYDIIPIIGKNSNEFFYAYGINNDGWVTGYTSSSSRGFSSSSRGFLWQSPENYQLFGDNGTYPTSLNNNNVVAGYMSNGSAFYYNGTIQTVTGFPNAEASWSYGINDHGDILIESKNRTTGHYQAGYYDQTQNQLISIGTLGGNNTIANAINNHKQVVGSSDVNAELEQAYIFHNGRIQNLGGYRRSDFSEARDINDSSTIVGWAYYPPEEGDDHFYGAKIAFIAYAENNWRLTPLQSEEFFYSIANAINNNNTVVGSFSDDPSFDIFNNGFIWNQEKGFVKINDILESDEWKITQIHDINDRGEMIGTAQNLQTLEYRDVVIRPTNPEPIPEPSTWVLLGLGMFALLWQQARRRL